MKILCEVATKGRTHTTLPLCLISIALQTQKPDKLIIFDDNEVKEDLRKFPIYQYIFALLDRKKIEWCVLYGESKGQHFCHQKAQEIALAEGFDAVLRIDDDEVAEHNVLECLKDELEYDLLAVGCPVIDPTSKNPATYSNEIKDVYTQANGQWHDNPGVGKVEHLYSSFLYKPGYAKYNLGLSPAAHREETLFTYELSKKGKLLINTEAIIWHFRFPEGGIRNNKPEAWKHDEEIFKNIIGLDKKVFILNEGFGDHIVFKKVLEDSGLKDYVIYGCYPELFEDMHSIQEAKDNFGDISQYSLYEWMDRVNWKGDLYEAYKTFYDIM